MSRMVFVSHTTTDHELAEKLVGYLEQHGISCFIAPRDMDPGIPYAANLVHAIDQCQLVILVASEAINHSEHVLNEVDILVEKNKPILSILAEDFKFNDDLRYYLGRKQWVVAYPDPLPTYYPKILASIKELLPQETLREVEQRVEPHSQSGPGAEALSGSKTVFEYDAERGIMINPEDHIRNISFRVDTFQSLMGSLYDSLAEASDADNARAAFYQCGLRSGTGFGKRIAGNWNNGYSLDGVRKTLEKWCQFDSAVGWGRFNIDIDYDEEADELVGILTISEAFIVDNAEKRYTCDFIKGYCTGVLRELLQMPDIQLTCKQCPMGNRFKCKCVFEMRTVM